MRLGSLALAATLLVTGPTVTSADWVETFDSADFDQNWVFRSIPDNSGFTATSGGGQLLIESSDQDAAFGFVGTEQFSSPGVTVRSVLNPDGIELNDDIGVLAHLDPTLLSAYGFTINFDGTDGNFDLTRLAGGSVVEGESSNIADFDPMGTYVVELTATAQQRTGRVLDTEGNVLGEVMMFDDNPLTSGYAGLLASRDGGSSLTASYGLTSASAVPEPSSLAALGIIAASVVYLRRRR